MPLLFHLEKPPLNFFSRLPTRLHCVSHWPMKCFIPRLIPVLTLVACFIHTVSFSQNDPIVNAGKPMSPLERHIHQTCKDVVDKNKTTDNFTEEDLADLPIGIARQIGNGIYVIAIDSAYWDGKGWFFSAYASITIPGTTRSIAFRARNVEFNKNGLASLSETKLALASPQWININDNTVLELPADGSNFVEFDCSGFKSVNIKGNFVFNDNIIIPAHNTTSPGTSLPDSIANIKYVVASFETNVSDLSNWMVSVNILPFKIKNIDDVTFEVKNAVVDFSDYANPPSFTFPTGYQQPYSDLENLWKGFYLQELRVYIDGLSGSAPTTIAARNLIIDETGVSGTVAGTNVLSLGTGPSPTPPSDTPPGQTPPITTAKTGSADGWAFSVENLSMQFVQNRLMGGEMNGKIAVPFLGGEEKPLIYQADIHQSENYINYLFSIITSADTEYTTKHLKAKIKLGEGSMISIERKNGKLLPSAILNGSISIADGKMKCSGIEFQNLALSSESPYVHGAQFSLLGQGQGESVGFAIRIDNIVPQVVDGKFELAFSVSINFMAEDAKGFAASTRIHIAAEVEETVIATGSGEIKKQEWKFAGIKVSEIALACNTTAFAISGKLTMFDDDPQFGDGFRGSLSLSIKKVLERGIQVNGYFGSKDNFRYWHLDAYVPTVAIPIVPPLAINGIIGGASYKMTRKQAFSPDFTQLTSTGSAGNSITQSEFIPDARAGLSFMAGVTLIAGNEKAFNSDAVLEVAFNTSGGLRYAQFKGAGYFLTSTESRGRASDTQPVPAPVFADLNMIYDQDNGVFHANLKTYLNLEGKVRGTGANNMMGEAVIHVDSRDWYIYMGRPSQMLGVDVANLAVAQGYFMAGTQLEQLPPPPPELREIMEEREEALVQDETTLTMGRGFALGLRFQTGYDSKDKIKPFYAVFSIGAGADVMIRDFGNATCLGSTDRIGFDGWYASGQAYVFMKGKVGIKVRGKKIDFLSLGAAALLQAKLPNPTWLKGEMAGRYSVLGGLVSGKFNIKIVVGDECEISTPGGELGDIVVIADLKPDAGSNDVSVFTSPQVTFNTAMESELSMLNNQDELTTYRIVLDEFNIKHNGQNLAGTREWNAKKDALALRTSEILPPQASLQALVKIHWEKKLNNGNWEALKENNQIDYETKAVNFVTGAAPDFIPEENVVYSYPVKNQYNFFPDEYGQGYVKLRHGQAYLFQPSPTDSVRWIYLARFKESSGNVIEAPIRYNVTQATVDLNIPEGLNKETVYRFSFIKKPESSDEVDKNIKRDNVKKDAGEGNEVNTRSNTLKGTIVQSLEKDIYTSAFRTSQYRNFSEKLAAASTSQNLFDVAIGNIAVIGKRLALSETFDNLELRGNPNHHKPLVQLTASYENNWMKNVISPMMYDTYPLDPGVSITRRNTDSLGVRPLRAVSLYNQQENYILTETNISSGISTSKSGLVKILYFLSFISFGDYDELRNKAASRAIAGGSVPQAVTRLLRATGYTDLMSGSYPVTISYSLPGKDQITTQKQIVIQF